MKHSNTQNYGILLYRAVFLGVAIFLFAGLISCGKKSQSDQTILVMHEKQISHSNKNHSLDNNDNFSPDNKYLCYDTRGTVFNTNIGNSKTIEKIEIATGTETVLYQPESVTGEDAAPGVGAVSWHPSENKVVFIHGPDVEDVEARGYYDITNRTGVEVSADGKETTTKVDMRDVMTSRPTTPGAQRGGTHRHEYSRNGNRIGFTYDDFLNTHYDRTIGYMEKNSKAPEGYSHYFAVILKPAKKGTSKPGEIEKASGDSWIDRAGTMRGFIGKVRAENGVDYKTDVFIADVPESVDITTAFSGNDTIYPEPPAGIELRRLTHSGEAGGIVRGSYDGKMLAYLSPDDNGIMQVFVINSKGSDASEDKNLQPQQVTSMDSNVSTVRWHPAKNWLFTISNGNIAAICAEPGPNFGKTIMMTTDGRERKGLVVSGDGNILAYTLLQESEDGNETKRFKQIFILQPDWKEILKTIK